VIFVLVAPYAVLLVLSLSNREYLSLPDGALSLRWYGTVFSDPRWLGAIVTSLIVGVAAAVVAVLLGLATAVGLRDTPRRWGRMLLVLFITPAVLPTMIYSIAAYFGAAKIGLIDSHVGLILAHTMLAVPLVVIVCGTALGNLGRSVERAAHSLGAPPATTFRRVTLPLIMPGVLTALVIAFQTSFDEIVVSLFLSGVTTRTLPKALWQASTLEVTPVIPAVAVVLVAVVLAAGACMMLLSRVAFGFRAHVVSGRGVA
jgi:ABC-type spermidine/putrescine transport system permease subunit II